MATYKGDSKVGTISAMHVLIEFEQTSWCEFRIQKRGEEHIFTNLIQRGQGDDLNYDWQPESVPLNAHAIRDDFQKVKTPLDALDFLNKTGRLSVLDQAISWSRFKRWQRFAYLVQEHEALASAQREIHSSDECVEVLRALSGKQESPLFDGTEIEVFGSPERLKEIERWTIENPEEVEKNKAIRREIDNELFAWFRQPPNNACSIVWVPKTEEDHQSTDAAVRAGALLEYLLPQRAMRPLLVIQPSNTLEAIAAAIYADRIEGIAYRACEVCSDLFLVGTRDEKKYCSRERCKNTAHQRRMRASRAKDRKLNGKQPERKA